MELMRTQKILARIYTEASLREKFFADPQSVAKELRLTEAEAEFLARVPAAQVDDFAKSLTRKRAREAAKLLPVTARALGKSFEPLFLEHAEAYRPKGIRKHFDDALAFAQFLDRCAGESTRTPAWIADLASYEAAALEATHSTCRFVWRYFRYPVAQVFAAAASRDFIRAMERRPGIAIWFRAGRRSRLSHLVLNFPVLSKGLVTLGLNDWRLSHRERNPE